MVKKYRDRLNISSEKWLELLNNKEVFREDDLELIKVILDKNDIISGSAIAEKIGKKNHGVLNLQVWRLGKRIIKFYTEIEYPKNDKGATRYWHIPFLGEDHPKEKRYYWELRPELKEAATRYFYSDSTYERIKSFPKDFSAIRILPMSEKDLEFAGKTSEEVQNWFKNHLPNRTYQFKNRMDTPDETLVLFQYQNRLIALAMLERVESYEEKNEYGYKGRYKFQSSSIAIFDPLSLNDVQEIWSGVKSFNQSSQKLELAQYGALKKLLSKRNFRFVEYEDEEDYQNAIGNMEVESEKVEDQPEDLIIKISKASEKIKWGRDPVKGKRAIVQVDFKCEADDSHTFFNSFITGKNYVEAHHLIPLQFQNNFINSLDVEANIVSLCPMCHKKVHHARMDEKLPVVEELYEKRKDRLEKCGIGVSLENLKSYY
ncbi:hypothetical protein QMA04_11410 [Planococcus sp. APC 3900]|uniref:hypothetical protein n=1 Tax=Planococcus sp. APC 3900 TaxID=3035191 RepID=UPI0025B55A30|nr:hypothetical protein [Planococcus sp. APC 3900]MDN3438704.1 hypothetical protein [Planococcus sp. APC 3900]